MLVGLQVSWVYLACAIITKLSGRIRTRKPQPVICNTRQKINKKLQDPTKSPVLRYIVQIKGEVRQEKVLGIKIMNTPVLFHGLALSGIIISFQDTKYRCEGFNDRVK